MLCNVKRPDDVTTAELNPVGFRIAIGRLPNPFFPALVSVHFVELRNLQIELRNLPRVRNGVMARVRNGVWL